MINNEPCSQLLAELKKMLNIDQLESEQQLSDLFKAEEYKRGQFFVSEGEIPAKLGFIEKGLLKYFYIDHKGNEWIKYFSAENSFVASYGSFLFQTASLYSIEAVEDTAILSISREIYMHQINSNLHWCIIARKFTEQIYFEKEIRESAFLKMNGTERYLNFLENYKHLVNRISVKDMASFLGLNPVSLSRIRSSIRY